MPEPVRYLDRRSGRLIEERILGEAVARWFYADPIGSRLFRRCLRGPGPSRLYGAWQDTRLSARAIRHFIAETGLDTDEILQPLDSFASFNAFFARRLKPEARPLDPAPDALISLGDGKVLVYPRLAGQTLIPVKGARIALEAMLADAALAARYVGGAAIVLRLAPTDYHRFHFIDAGVPSAVRELPGGYDSVNPIALGAGRPIFAENHRAVSTLASERFGTVAYVEVGAFLVGSIVQSFTPGLPVQRGDEKGFFQFGGSTVVLVFEPDRVRFDADLLAASAAGTEVAVRFGERLGAVG